MVSVSRIPVLDSPADGGKEKRVVDCPDAREVGKAMRQDLGSFS